MLAAVLALPTSLSGVNADVQFAPSPQLSFADGAFKVLWEQTDGKIAAGRATGSWLWGPEPGHTARETYAQAVDGSLVVQYFDKGRMELQVSREGENWNKSVSSGLLVSELVTGRVQTGAKESVQLEPSSGLVAGDKAAPGLRYADFAAKMSRVPNRTGAELASILDANGPPASVTSRVRVAEYAAETGHNVPDIFATYIQETLRSAYPTLDPLQLVGYPITDAYWTPVTAGGKNYFAVVQLFQRRTLTFVPDFPLGWQVQMGNVGQHYVEWRYSEENRKRLPSIAETTSLRPASGRFVGIEGDRFMYEGRSVKLKGTNYWYSVWPFQNTWAGWDGPAVREELRKAKELGVNAVRIGVPFNHGQVSDMIWLDDDMSRLNPWIVNIMTQVVQIAAEYDMKVIFTLFEWYDRQPAPGSTEEKANLRYVQGIVGAFANDDRVLAWDLRNEPDNYETWRSGRADAVIEWLARIAKAARASDSRHPLTVGVGNYRSLWTPARDGTTLLSLVDVAQFHSYDAGALAGQIEEVRSHTTKPIFLGEMGWPTSSGAQSPPDGTVMDEPTQTFLYSTMLEGGNTADLAGLAQWTLWDYAPGSTSNAPDYEEFFGLVRRDGTYKPVAPIFRDKYQVPPLPSDTKSRVPLDTADHPARKP